VTVPLGTTSSQHFPLDKLLAFSGDFRLFLADFRSRGHPAYLYEPVVAGGQITAQWTPVAGAASMNSRNPLPWF